jgi:CubicO group peptidase (beta-lactamase class C family)
MDDYKVPGVSITVIKDFKVDWSKQYGVMDTELNNPVTDETIFNVGSLSKGVAALTILSLTEEGKIDLNSDINQQLRSWKIPENEFTKQGTVTPFLLMNHSGGASFMPGATYCPIISQQIFRFSKGNNHRRQNLLSSIKYLVQYQYSNGVFPYYSNLQLI